VQSPALRRSGANWIFLLKDLGGDASETGRLDAALELRPNPFQYGGPAFWHGTQFEMRCESPTIALVRAGSPSCEGRCYGRRCEESSRRLASVCWAHEHRLATSRALILQSWHHLQLNMNWPVRMPLNDGQELNTNVDTLKIARSDAVKLMVVRFSKGGRKSSLQANIEHIFPRGCCPRSPSAVERTWRYRCAPFSTSLPAA
jgi:hypothetical protein